MMPIPIAQFLGRLTAASPAADMVAVAAARALAAADAAAEHQATVEREREAAYQQGIRDGQTSATASFEQALAEERALAEARLAEERALWAAQAGAGLARTLRETFEALEHRLADQAGRVLEPFLGAQILARALRELRQALSVLLTGADAAAVRICGPSDLLAAMRESAGGALDAVEFVETDCVDISVVAADTTIASQLQSWVARLREAVT